jgi:hypothetical protein
MTDFNAIKALAAAAFCSDPIDEIRQEAATRGPILIMVLPDGSLVRGPHPEVPDIYNLKESSDG